MALWSGGSIHEAHVRPYPHHRKPSCRRPLLDRQRLGDLLLLTISSCTIAAVIAAHG